jgi:hypothetical protein
MKQKFEYAWSPSAILRTKRRTSMAPKRCTLALLLTAISLFLLSTGAWGQVEFTYGISYFSNANTSGAPDGKVRLVNPGTLGTFTDICASIYVVNYDEQLTECCSCRLSPNEELELSINALTANPLIGIRPTHGDIKVVASLPVAGVCNAAVSNPTTGNGITFVIGLDGWATHPQRAISPSWLLTETGFALSFGTNTTDPTLVSEETNEINDLAEDCLETAEGGSGNGDCSATAVALSAGQHGAPNCRQTGSAPHTIPAM